jgi:hypothetical protein
MMDYLQFALARLNTDTPNWWGFAKTDSDGNVIPNDQRMTYDNAIVIIDGVTKPTETQVNAKIAEIKLDEVRSVRNAKLAETDWVVTMHKELGTNIPTAMKTYRQALRDITDSATSLDDVVWPEKP